MRCDIKSNRDSVEYQFVLFITHREESSATILGYYNGWYCTNDKSFLSDNQVVEVGKDGQKLKVR